MPGRFSHCLYVARRCAGLVFAASTLLVLRLGGQEAPSRVRASPWGDPQVDTLVQRAIARRGLQLADSTLLSYQAQAHGFLAFLAQVGEGAIIPPKVVQSEELALTIAWWQPGRSAQRLVGRRDTTLLPSSVGYYRDRYSVVLDNLPDRIRLGDGQDVRDVPHPLAAGAAALYEYALGSPIQIRIPGRDILVDEVKFRPRNPALPGAIGSVFLDRASAAVVRLSMTFTRAAILDKRIETLVVTLENGLVRERYWLPRRQEVEVSRGSTWFDLPVRGVVRGRWEISGYDVNELIPVVTKLLPRWSSAPRDSLRAHAFADRIVDVLPPEIQIASSEDVVQARVAAEAAVRSAMLARPATAAVTGRGISDLGRFSRAEGLALGVGASHKNRTGVMVSGRVRYGFADQMLKWHLGIGPSPAFGRTPTVQLFAERDYRELGFTERAGVTNSLAAMLFGSDASNPVETRAVGVEWRRTPRSAWSWRLAYETDRPLPVAASPLKGTFQNTIDAYSMSGVRAEVRGTGGWVGAEPRASRGLWSLQASLGAAEGTEGQRPLGGRVQAMWQMHRPLAHDMALFVQSHAGVANGRDLPPQWLIFAGGPLSAPGYAFQQFRSRALLSQRVELRLPLPAPAISLGRYGRVPPHVTVAPFGQLLATAAGTRNQPTTAGLYPSAGVGLLFFYDLVRADVARGLRDGRWRFAIDIDRGFWGML